MENKETKKESQAYSSFLKERWCLYDGVKKKNRWTHSSIALTETRELKRDHYGINNFGRDLRARDSIRWRKTSWK